MQLEDWLLKVTKNVQILKKGWMLKILITKWNYWYKEILMIDILENP